jgi:hypothetical protein
LRIDESDAVGCTVLDTVGLVLGDRHTGVPDGTGQRARAVGGTAVPVVEDEAPAAQVGADRRLDLDRLTGVGTGVVVVDLADEDVTVGRDGERGRGQEAETGERESCCCGECAAATTGGREPR